MTKNRSYSIAFKRQVAEEYLAGAAPSELGKRHDLCRNLIRIWVRKHEAGEYDDDVRAADTLQEFEAKVAALEQLVGRQALEIEFLKKAVKSARSPNGASTSAITGPPTSASRGGAR
jgi:transposase-like protein